VRNVGIRINRLVKKGTTIPYYKKSVKTIKRWLGEIGEYFEQRTTNWIVEGIKVLPYLVCQTNN